MKYIPENYEECLDMCCDECGYPDPGLHIYRCKYFCKFKKEFDDKLVLINK